MGWDADPVREGGEGGYRVRFWARPEVFLLSYSLDISEELWDLFGIHFRRFVGHFRTFFKIILDFLSECLGMLWGPFGTIWDRCGRILRFFGEKTSST